MIAPRTALLLWTAFVLVPMAGWLTVAPGPVPVLIILAGVCAVVWDAVRSREALAYMNTIVPGTVRLARQRSDRIVIRLAGKSDQAGTIRVGCAFPEELGVRHDIRTVHLRPGQREGRVEWNVYPLERGRYRLDACHLETPSRWRFWNVRRTVPVALDILVYPGLLSERRRVPALFMRRGFVGIQHQRRFGKGREFEQLRDYQPGDSLEDIHWKATAKRGHPVTKMFQIERTQEVYVAIDASRLSGRRIASKRVDAEHEAEDAYATEPLVERYVNSALLLGRAAEMQGDLFGLITFSDRLLSFVRARRGHGHYRACLDAVCRLQPQPVAPDFGEVCSFIRHQLRRRALIIVLTQLDDPVLAESVVRDLELIRRQHLVAVCMPAPPLIRPLFSEAQDVDRPEDLYAALGGHLRWRRLREISDALQKKGIGFLLTPDDSMLASLVTHYLNIKQRQML